MRRIVFRRTVNERIVVFAETLAEARTEAEDASPEVWHNIQASVPDKADYTVVSNDDAPKHTY